jgi:hypothetical protein
VEDDGKLGVIDPSSFPVDFWLHHCEPWVAEDGFIFSEVREEEAEVDLSVSCLDQKVRIIEEIAALV